MPFLLTFTSVFLQGLLLICLGEIIRKHFETIITMIFRKPLSEDLINPKNHKKANRIIATIGILMIIMGVVKVISGVSYLF